MPMLAVEIPKTVKIKNKRLGCLNIVFTLVAVLLVLFNLVYLRTYFVQSLPVDSGLSIWMGGTKAEGYESLLSYHCTPAGVASFKWAYDSTQAWDPKSCRKPETGTDHQKAPGQIFLPTYINDSHVDGDVEIVDEYLVQNPEYMVLWVMHGYEVGDINIWGESAPKSDSSSVDTTRLQTIIMKSDGLTECKVNGRSRWKKKHSTWGIYGPIKDWLACADVDLDAVGGVSYGESAITGEGYPRVRIAGVSLVLQLEYYNREGMKRAKKDHLQGPHSDETCLMKVVALENWNSGVTMAYTSPPAIGGVGGKWRRRYATGITITAQSSGSFSYVSYNSILQAVVAALVILKLPGVVMKIITYHLVGLLSKIYKGVGIEELNVEDRLDGFATRLMGYASAFRVLTGQTTQVVHGMTTAQVGRYMHEVFHKQKEDGTLDDDEIAKMSAYITMRMENSERKSVSEVTLDKFIESAAANEPLMPKDLAALFDVDRKPGILERCLGNVKTERLHNQVAEGDEELRKSGQGDQPPEAP